MNGRFDTNITYLAGTDIPDLYFWVEYLINGTWTTVYKPNVPCNTFWDYKCGTEVTIRVTDERVGWGCPEILGGEIVWVKTIGHGASVSHIRQDNFSQGVTNDAAATFNRIGLTNALVSSSAPLSSQYIRPFGGNLYFLLQFSSGLPKTGIYYYKWKYCKTHRPDLSVLVASPTDTDFTDMDNTVNKSYTFEYKDFFNITRFDSKSVKLGPNTVGTQDNLYQIPPINPAMAPFNASETSPQWDQNTASINFDSNSLDGDGLYEFRLELFDKAGNKVTNLPRTIFQVPHPTSFTPSVNAPNNMLVPPLGATASAYTMKVRIDNQPCEAAIYKIKKGGVETTSDCCGFVKYVNNAAPLEVSFKAYHPHNLGEFSFGITKGTCSDPAMSNVTKAVGVTLGNANAYARDVNGKYSKNFFPSVLLGICNAGGKAAFAETLSVFTLAIDGNNRLSYLDRHDVAAFALEP